MTCNAVSKRNPGNYFLTMLKEPPINIASALAALGIAVDQAANEHLHTAQSTISPSTAFSSPDRFPKPNHSSSAFIPLSSVTCRENDVVG
jgi:hypothetical protein